MEENENASQEPSGQEPQEGASEEGNEPSGGQEPSIADIIAENNEKLFSRISSQMGRYRKQDQDRMAELEQRLEQMSAKPQEEEEDFGFVSTREDFEKLLNEHENKKTNAQKQFTDSAVAEVGRLVQDNRLYLNEDNTETAFGKAVGEVMKSGKVQLDNTLPPKAAAKQVLAEASILAMQAMGGGTKTALDGNEPKNRNEGGITPGAGKQDNKPMPKLSAAAARLAEKLGRSPEEAAEMIARSDAN